MAKKVTAVVKLQIPAGKATPAPPVSSTLGPYGINMMEFLKKFNEMTAPQMGYVLPVVITVFEDRSYNFVVKQPLMSALIKKAMGIESGSKTPGKASAGVLTMDKALEVARAKLADLNTTDEKMAVRIVAGTARSMGIDCDF